MHDVPVTASFIDGINPSAIARQMLLQAMVKKKRYVLFFMLGIGLANAVAWRGYLLWNCGTGIRPLGENAGVLPAAIAAWLVLLLASK